jgi:nucleoside phosphorylase
VDDPIAVVLSAIPVEYQAMHAHLRDRREERHPAGTIFKLGGLPNSRWLVRLAEMGTGNPQAAIIAERAIRHFRPDLVMLVGIAGRLHTDLSLGDIVVATKTYAIHSGKEGRTGFRPRPESWQANHACDQQARRVAEHDTWQDALRDQTPMAKVVFRSIASGEVVLDAPRSELKQRLDRDYADAAVIEMEGAGVARACHLNNVPMMNIRAVSDFADGKKEATDRAGGQLRAARNAAAFAVTLLAELTPVRYGADAVEYDLLFGIDERRRAAVLQLGSGRHENAVPLLVKGFYATPDSEESVRIIWALSKLGNSAAREALESLTPRYDIEQSEIHDALKRWRDRPQ